MGLQIPMFQVLCADDVLGYMEKCQPGQNPEIYSEWMRRRARAFLKCYYDNYLVRLKEGGTVRVTRFLDITEPEAESSGESEASLPLACPASNPAASVNLA